MAEELGALRVSIGLDSADFTQGLQNINRRIRGLNSEFRVGAAGNNNYANTIEGMRARTTQLNGTLTLQQAHARRLREEYNRVRQASGENSREAQNLAIRYNNSVAAMRNTEAALRDVNQQLADAQNSWRNAGISATETGERLSRIGAGMTSVGKDLSMKVTAPIVGIGVAASKMAMDFESQMDRVGAIAGATGSEMEGLSKVALELGANTSKSASEVAVGMENMAAMGFEVNEIIGAMPGVISAAEASGADMAQTADVVAAALNSFGLEAGEASRVADILAQSANQSAADITDLQYAFKYAAPIANSLGISIEELAAATGLMSDAGMKGEQAGTTLRGGLIALLKPAEQTSKMMTAMGITVEDAEGNFVGLSGLIANITEALEGQTQVQKLATLSQLVGTEAASGFLTLMEEGPEKIDSMTKSLENSAGASAETAKKMKDNLKGAMDELGGSLESAAISLGTKFIPTLEKGSKYIKELVDKFEGMSPASQNWVIGLSAAAAAIGPVLIGAGVLASSLGAVFTAIGTVSGAIGVVVGGATAATPAIGALATAFTILTGPVGLVVAGLAAVGVGAYLLAKEMKKPTIEVDIFGEKVSEATQKAVQGYLDLESEAKKSMIGVGTVTAEEATEITETHKQMTDMILAEMDKQHAKQIEKTTKYFADSKALSEKEEAEILTKEKKKQEDQAKAVLEGQKRIEEILATSVNNKRGITEAEKAEIAKIEDDMRVTAVATLSKSETEQKVILERLKAEASKISAQQAAEVVANSVKQKNETVKEANDQYNQTIAEIIRLRDETGSITADQAKKMITEAENQRNGTVKNAEEMHTNVVKEAKAQAGEHVAQVDWTTGQVKSKWRSMVDQFKADNAEAQKQNKEEWEKISKKTGEIVENVKNTVSTKWKEMQEEKKRRDAEIKKKNAEDWEAIKTFVVGKSKEISEKVSSDAKQSYKNFTKWTGDLVDAGLKKWEGFKKGVGKIWSDVKGDMRSLVGKMLDYADLIINGPIRGLNTVMGALKIGKTIPEWPKPTKYAKGTDGHPGGLALVNDGVGSNYKEIIQTPNGKLGMFSDRNVLLDLPRGSKVLSGEKTKEVMKINSVPHYKDGVGMMDWLSMLGDPVAMIKKAAGGMMDKLPEIGGAPLEIGVEVGKTALSSTAQYLQDKIAEFFTFDLGDGFAFPSPPYTRTSGFGQRWGKLHAGVDWAAPTGTAIPSQTGGKVSFSGPRGGYGNAIIVDAGGGMQYLYGHNSANLVKVGDTVAKGQTIGLVGSTGDSTGPHVHFEIRKNGKAINPDSLGVGGGKISGSLSNWISAGMAKAGVSGANWMDGLAWIINKESSGNPRAVGAPTSDGTAKGLMQLKHFNYKGDPFDPVNNIAYGIRYIQGRYKSIEGALSWWRSHNWYKNGTNFHPGGLATVNDGNGPELIQFPGGKFGMFKGKNVLTDLPRGTKVLPHEKTKEVMRTGLLDNVPQYAAGIGDLTYVVKAGDTLSKIAKSFKTTVDQLVKLNNIKNKDLIQIGQVIKYGAQANIGIGKNALSTHEKAPVVPTIDNRPQYAKDVTYLANKASKGENAEIVRLEKVHMAQMIALEKEREAKIKAIKDKATKAKRDLTQKEKEAVWKLREDYDKKEVAAEKALNDQVAELQKAGQQKQLQEIDAYVARKKEAGKLSLIEEIKIYRESMRYYKKNSEEWFEAERKMNAAKVLLNNELKTLKDDYLAKVKDVNQRVIDEEKRLNDEYKRAVDDRAKTIAGFAGLFDEVAKPEEIDPQTLVDNLQSQVWALNNWASNLDHLGLRGINDDLLAELQDMGPQALPYIKALVDMTDTQLDQFQSLWSEKSNIARNQAVEEMAGLKLDTLKEIEALHRDAEIELDEMNATFVKKMNEIRTGAVGEFNPFGAQMVDIGKNAIQGLIDGMAGMTGPLSKKMNEISGIMVNTMKKDLEIKSPSRKADREVSAYFGAGLIGGLNKIKSPLIEKMAEISSLFTGVVPVPDIPSAAFSSASGFGGGNSYDYSSTITPKIVLNYYGSGSEQDAMNMVDIVDSELSWRTQKNLTARGMKSK
ncbi:phage tail tape measure protein [Domibacillus aminovorans]|uniref:LysM domain-containing protein n=1 Tax=Domibacillus aminovorans TaxID=29332 RepID=A0A177L4P3_9BACI|nr:phage tail tape measure protein [Domibacillus aminovorans]OAH60649.1 hypothetical protein AWH49_15560 [Domibacillus aminovorans]